MTSATIGPAVCYADDDAPLFCAAMARALAESATELTQVWQDVGARRVWVGVARDDRAAGVRSCTLLNACPWCGRALQQPPPGTEPTEGATS